jgi:hypothetical protein
MNPLYFALTAGVLNAISAQILKNQPQNNEEQSGFQVIMAVFQVIFGVAILIPVALYFNEKVSWVFVLSGFAMGVFGFSNFVTICVALRRGPMSIVWPTAWLAAPLSGTIWFIVTGFKDFTYWHGIGIGLFVLSLYCMSKTKPKAPTGDANEKAAVSQNEIKPYFFLHIALGMLTGVCGNFVTKFVSQLDHAQEVVPQTTTFASMNLLSIFCIYFMWRFIFKTKVALPKLAHIECSALNALLAICMFFLTIYGFKNLDIATFMCSYAGVAISGAVVMAYLFQKEKISKPVFIGIICSLFAIGSFALGDKAVKDFNDAKAKDAKQTATAPANPGK